MSQRITDEEDEDEEFLRLHGGPQRSPPARNLRRSSSGSAGTVLFKYHCGGPSR
jgi:hypothetical protein